jgi:hypothetical protein
LSPQPKRHTTEIRACSSKCDIYKSFSSSKSVIGANLFGANGTDTLDDYSTVVVYMAWGHLQDAVVHLATTGGGSGFGVGTGVELKLNPVSDSI